MSRRTIRLAVVSGAVAASALCGGVALAAEYPVPPPVDGGGGGGVDNGGSGSGGTGTTGGENGSAGGSGSLITYSNGGEVSGGGSASTSDSDLPFTGFELVTAVALGAGAIGAGTVFVVASRRRRDTSALA